MTEIINAVDEILKNKGEISEQSVDTVSRIIAEQSGSDPERVKMILLDLMKKDADISNIIDEIAKVRNVTAGEASEKAVDVLVARLLAKLSKRIERKIEESDSVDDLIKLITIKTLLDSMNNNNMQMIMKLIEEKNKKEKEFIEEIYKIRLSLLQRENQLLKKELEDLKNIVRQLQEEIRRRESGQGNSESEEGKKGRGPIAELVDGITEPVVRSILKKFNEKLEQSGLIDDIAEELVRVTAESAKDAVNDIALMESSSVREPVKVVKPSK